MCEQRKRLKPPLVRWAGSGQGPGGFMVQAQAMGRFYAENCLACVCVREIFPAGPVAAGS